MRWELRGGLGLGLAPASPSHCVDLDVEIWRFSGRRLGKVVFVRLLQMAHSGSENVL